MTALGGYLAAVGFSRAHRFAASPQRYDVSPDAVRAGSPTLDALVRWTPAGAEPLRGHPDLRLAGCLMTGAPLALDAVPRRWRELAEALVAAGLLGLVDGHLRPASALLISVAGLPLLIDARIHTPGAPPHAVYIGPDSLALIRHLAEDAVPAPGRRGAPWRALDLGTGTGVIALQSARRGAGVVATDLSPAALRFAALNMALNGLEARVSLRHEGYDDTYARGERYDLVTINPPFMPIPAELRPPLFAGGSQSDGLGEVRGWLAALDAVVAPEGRGLLVADFLGDQAGVFFERELDALGRERGWRFLLLIESSVDLTIDHTLLRSTANHIALTAAGGDRHAIYETLRRHYLETLGARAHHLGVVIARRASERRAPGLVVLDRRLAAQGLARR